MGGMGGAQLHIRENARGLGPWLLLVIVAYTVLMRFALAEFSFGPGYENTPGTPYYDPSVASKGMTDLGVTLALMCATLAAVGLALSVTGVARRVGARRNLFVVAAAGAFGSLIWAAGLAYGTF
jgi:hypothetical protein